MYASFHVKMLEKQLKGKLIIMQSLLHVAGFCDHEFCLSANKYRKQSVKSAKCLLMIRVWEQKAVDVSQMDAQA